MRLTANYEGFRHFWHGLTPKPGDSTLNPINRVKLQAMYSSKLAYFAYTMAMVGNYWLLLGPGGVTQAHKELLLTHRVATLCLVNAELANMQGLPSEELIGAVVVMAAADPDHFLKQADSNSRHSRFQSPLAKAQVLHIIGHEPLVSAHYLALWRLIRLKGAAWEDYHDFGLAEICELLCIIHASIAGEKPEFPAIDRSRHAFFSGHYDTGDAAKDLRLKLSMALPSEWLKSLLELSFLRSGPSMMDVIVLMKHISLALEHFHRGARDAPDFANIIQARTGIQHKLLSLPQDPEGMSPADMYLYKLCRFCLLIYSNMVLFPLPPSSGVGTQLAMALKALLIEESQTHVFARDTTELKLLLWAVVLGGISDGSDVDRSWFQDQYRRVASDIGIGSWQQLETQLTSFLWLDFVLNKEAVGFWAESRMRSAPGVLP
ncbi:hypothetical protein PV08_09036 [Exophiala spinifera]|uniref:Transcription factor domain-containing protein n=1 Tax=Exophiala spinifera TaxID=91928 RepID=A0A0D2BKF4_9EURO|nr:uncharacterized protein PV08_09036 [Exophiala spinifera]KIW11764.1 hypothetical protein PV08_09036 [Exophiala spinifera]